MAKKSLPETECAEGAGRAGDASRATLKVEVVPSSAVCPMLEMSMSKKSLPETAGSAGGGPAVDLLRATLKVEVVPTSAVLPDIFVISNN